MVKDLIEKIMNKVGGEIAESGVIYAGKELTEAFHNLTLKDLGIENESSIHVVFRQHGGSSLLNFTFLKMDRPLDLKVSLYDGNEVSLAKVDRNLSVWALKGQIEAKNQ
jgi:hypothetical protein